MTKDFALDTCSSEITELGYTIIPTVFTTDEINSIVQIIDAVDSNNFTFRKSNDLFGIFNS